MDINNTISDIGAAAGLLLFTGAESTVSGDGALDLISKLGVIAVLWLWLRDMKAQMKEQSDRFDKESDEINNKFLEELKEIRLSNEKVVDRMSLEHKDYINKQEVLINELRDDVKLMQDKLINMTTKK